MNSTSYYNWFKKVIAIFIELFFFFTVISCLYVFTEPFSGIMKAIVFVIIAVVIGLFLYFFRNKIKDIINKLIHLISKLNTKQKVCVIILTMLVLKVVYTIFLYFDPTQGGDIGIYSNIADHILENGIFGSNEISHLMGLGIHLAVIKGLGIPYHIGIFVIFLIGNIINFFSFKNIIGENKSFLVVMLYILMPSTMLLTFCPTHEIFIYLYFSIFICVLNCLVKTDNLRNRILLSIVLVIDVILANSVSPMGKLLYIIMGLLVLLSNIDKINKIIVICLLVISLLGSNLISDKISPNDYRTTWNTYSILMYGSSIECNGEHSDTYTQETIRNYYTNHPEEEDTIENVTVVLRNQLISNYIYLLSHPIDMVKLFAHKYYKFWSGDHYSIEIMNSYLGINTYIYYLLLIISEFIYLGINALSIALYREKEDDINISNSKLLLLGVVGVLILSLVLNKYSIPITIFMFMIAVYRTDLIEE